MCIRDRTYGAPISEEQVPQIVKYLMATKEAGKTASWESQTIQKRDDAPRISLATSSADRVHDEQRGGALYATHCAMCHGPTGAGDGASAGDKFPRPTDLSAARYQPQTLADAIHSGVPGTSMPGYPSLSNDDLRALVTFTRGLTAKEPDQPRAASDAIAQAKSLYAQNCVTCHGPDGAGDGLAATTL